MIDFSLAPYCPKCIPADRRLAVASRGGYHPKMIFCDVDHEHPSVGPRWLAGGLPHLDVTCPRCGFRWLMRTADDPENGTAR